jgi:hypothetical protein
MFNDQLMRLVTSKLEALGFRTDNDNVIKTKKVTIGFADSVAGAEVETDFVFPTKCEVLDVILDVTTKEDDGGTKTIIIGTTTATGDPNGFANGVSVAAAALVRGGAAMTAGGNETYYSGNTRGALLSDWKAGSNAVEDVGHYREFPDLSSGGETLTWTPGSNDFAQLAADIYVTYIDLT